MKRILLSFLFLLACSLPAWATQAQINPFTPQFGWNYGPGATLRIFVTQSFVSSEGVTVVASPIAGPNFYKSVPCTVSGTQITVQAFTLYTTTDATPNTARYTFIFYDKNGTRRDTLWANYQWPTVYGQTMTSSQLEMYNRATQVSIPQPGFPTTDQVQQMIKGTLATEPIAQGATMLSSGVAVIPQPTVQLNNFILITGQDKNVTGSVHVSDVSPGSGFTLTSSNGADNGTVFWSMYPPNFQSTTLQTAGLESDYVGDSGSGGKRGIVPAPAAGDGASGKFLSAAGGWQFPSGGSSSSESVLYGRGQGAGPGLFQQITLGTGLSMVGTVLSSTGGGGGGSGDVTGPSSATDTQLAVFNGATGKVIKAGTTTGIIKASSGVVSAAVAGTDYLTPTGSGSSLTGITPTQIGIPNVTNDTQTKAAIVPNLTPTPGQIMFGNAGGTAFTVGTLSCSGATCSLSSAGVLSLSAVPNASLVNSFITIAGNLTNLGSTVSLDSIDGIGSNGIIARTGVNTRTPRTITGSATVNVTNGDGVAGNPTLSVPNASVTNAVLATMAAHTYKGNNTGSTGAPLDLSQLQMTAELNAMVGDSGSGGTKGMVPAPASGDAAAGKFLKADGTWAVPAGGGGGSPGGSSTQLQRNNAGAFGGISGATSNGTNVTFGAGNLLATSPWLTTDIKDTNGVALIALTATASAVNNMGVANAATGNNPAINITGADTNVGLNVNLKGSGTFSVSGSGTSAIGIGDTDNSNYLNIQVGSNLTADRTLTLTTGDASRTITINGDITLPGGTAAVIGSSNSWAAGVTQTFAPNGTSSGLNVGATTANPSSPNNGDVYYNSTANELRARINGLWVALGAGGGGGISGLTTNKIPRATSSSTIGDSRLTDDGTNPISSSASMSFGTSPDVGFGEVASGVALITDGGADSSVSWGKLRAGQDVIAKTADFTVGALEVGVVYTNTGATTNVTGTLITPVVGMTYTFYRDADHTFQITAPASTTIRVGSSVTSTAGNITLDAVGSRLKIVAISTTKFIGELTGPGTFN